MSREELLLHLSNLGQFGQEARVMASSRDTNRVDVVALIVRKNNEILVEKRKKDRRVDPGKTAIPGGHVEDPESLEQACARELKEELELECSDFRFVASMPHDTISEKQMVHYYSCENWKGVPKNREADSIFWISIENLGCLDFEIDKSAIRRFLGQTSQT
jgi:8-oxo-dGTP diphosphatase